MNRKFLGVYLDKHLTWSDHTSYISIRLQKTLVLFLSSVRHCLPKTSPISLYYALIFPYLSYCNISWESNHDFRLNALAIFQKRAIRAILNLNWRYSIKSAFLKHGKLLICDITKLQVHI